jgi:methyl-accepting chemotaxis protein
MKWFHNLSVAGKLVALVLSSLILLAGIGIMSFSYLNEMSSSTEQIYHQQLLPVKWVNEARANSQGIEGNSYRFMLLNNKADIQRGIDENAERVKNLEMIVSNLSKISVDSFEMERLTLIQEKLNLFRLELHNFTEMIKAGKNDEALMYYSSIVSTPQNMLNNNFIELADYYSKSADSVYMQVEQDMNDAILYITFLSILALFVSSGIGYLVTRLILRPIREMQRLMEEASGGNLNVEGRYQSKDELGRLMNSFNMMIFSIKEVVRQVNGSAAQVASSSEDLNISAKQAGESSEAITLSAQELAAGAEKQVYAVIEGIEIVGQLASGAERVSATVGSLSETACQTAATVSEGLADIQSATGKMKGIHTNVNSLAEVIEQLDKQSAQIGQVAALISTIAAQTNLLALNAGIEAARAGEHGRGFSVVAAEIRKLAEQVSNSAYQVTEMVESIQEQTAQAVESAQSTSSAVDEGLRAVGSAGASFDRIELSIASVAAGVEQVKSDIQSISKGTGQIVERIRNIAYVAETAQSGTQNVSASTEEQLAAMEEITASATQLTHMAHELRGTVNRFKI